MMIINRVILACLVDCASVHAERMEIGEDSPLLQHATLEANGAPVPRAPSARFLDYSLVELLEDPALALTQEQQVKLSALLQGPLSPPGSMKRSRLGEVHTLLEDPALALTQEQQVKLSALLQGPLSPPGSMKRSRLGEVHTLLEDPALALTQEQQVKLSALLQGPLSPPGSMKRSRLGEVHTHAHVAQLAEENQAETGDLLQVAGLEATDRVWTPLGQVCRKECSLVDDGRYHINIFPFDTFGIGMCTQHAMLDGVDEEDCKSSITSAMREAVIDACAVSCLLVDKAYANVMRDKRNQKKDKRNQKGKTGD